ncbi:acyltransferase [Paenibacillus agaridevorans]|uniref:acyltransferase n=1 Tax=Paenibacillus agaridevorans TaxID=171404 RepID=UPI000D596128
MREQIETRVSSVELLRVIGFVMVIMIHVIGVGLALKTMSLDSLNWHFSNLIRSVSSIAVPCFFLISGFFMQSYEMKISKQIKKVMTPMIFYAILIYCINVIFFPEILPTPFMLLKDFMTSGSVYYHFWYVYIYICLILVSPFINLLLNRMPKEKMKSLLVTLYGIFIVPSSINHLLQDLWLPENLIYSAFLLSVTLYIQGAYIKRFGIQLGRGQLFIIFTIATTAITTLTYLYSKEVGSYVSSFHSYSNIFVVIAAVSFFSIFIRWELRKNLFINNIASKTYGGYLVHTLGISVLQHIFTKVSPFTSYNSPMYIPNCILYIGLVFLFSMIVEYTRKVLVVFVWRRIRGEPL